MRPLLSVIGQRPAASGAIVTVLVAALLFAATLQTDINGSNDFHMDDAGEFQVAWNAWGVTHPPGYPLINLTANVFTHLIRLFGVRPALAASLFSMLLGLAALSVLYRLLFERTGNPWVSAVATLLLAVSHLFWINSSIAEVYTLGMLFTALILWRGLRLAPERPEGTVWALAVILGLAVGHHRTLLLLLIPLVPLFLPAWRSIRPRTLLIALVLFILTFAVYLYLPLVTRWGSLWVYGRPPDTWEGFLDSFLGREYASQLTPPGTWEAVLAAMAERIRLVGGEITPIGVLLGLAGIVLAVLQGQNRRLATGLLLGLMAYVAAPVSEELLYGTHMLIMVAALYLVIGWGLLWTTLPGESHRRAASVVAGLVGSGLVIWLAWNNFGHIYAVTHDPAGREIIEGMKQVDKPRPPVVEVWGCALFCSGLCPLGEWRPARRRIDRRGYESARPACAVAALLHHAGPVSPDPPAGLGAATGTDTSQLRSLSYRGGLHCATDAPPSSVQGERWGRGHGWYPPAGLSGWSGPGRRGSAIAPVAGRAPHLR